MSLVRFQAGHPGNGMRLWLQGHGRGAWTAAGVVGNGWPGGAGSSRYARGGIGEHRLVRARLTILIAAATGLFFGIAPALRATTLDVNENLKEGMRGSTSGPRREGIRRALGSEFTAGVAGHEGGSGDGLAE